MRGKAILVTLLIAGSLAFAPEQKCCKSAAGSVDDLDNTGGIQETMTSTTLRDQDTLLSTIGSWLPATVDNFTFPCSGDYMYCTYAIRMTTASHCTGMPVYTPDRNDCIRQAEYSDWSMMSYQGPPSGPGESLLMGHALGADGNMRRWTVDITDLQNPVITWEYMFEVGDKLRSAQGSSGTLSFWNSRIEHEYVQMYVNLLYGCDANLAPLDSDEPSECRVIADVNSANARTAIAAATPSGADTAATYLDDVKFWSVHCNADCTRLSASVKTLNGDDIVAIFLTGADTWVAKDAQGDPHIDMGGTVGGYSVEVASGCPASSGVDYILFLLDSPSTEEITCDLHGGSHPGGSPGHLTYGFNAAVFSDSDATVNDPVGSGYERLNGWLFGTALAGVPSGGTWWASYTENLGGDAHGQPSWMTAEPAATTPIANQIVNMVNSSAEVAPVDAVPRERENFIFRPGCLNVLTYAPSMHTVASSAAGPDETATYYGTDKGPISSDGRWKILVSSHGTDRFDLFLIRVPRARLVAC